jgi:hypothetical protein
VAGELKHVINADEEILLQVYVDSIVIGWASVNVFST